MHQKINKLEVALKAIIFMTTVFFCPHCQKILGVSKTH